MASKHTESRKLMVGLAYLSPNILGFLLFTIFPLGFSLYMAFSNWDLTMHNMFKEGSSVEWIWFGNFIQLFESPNFWRYFFNTLFFMMAIPFSMAGSLLFAILLNHNLRGSTGSVKWKVTIGTIVLSGLLFGGCVLLYALGMGGSSMTLLIVGLFCVILIGGVSGGSTLYRTLFYTPHFTAGVATYLLWKKLYAPYEGPINQGLEPILNGVTSVYRALPSSVGTLGLTLLMAIGAWLTYWLHKKMVQGWKDGDAGLATILASEIIIIIPWLCAFYWLPGNTFPVICLAIIAVGVAFTIFSLSKDEPLQRVSAGHAFGTYFMLSMAVMVVVFTMIGLSITSFYLPTWAAEEGGLTPPEWLTRYHWAKPALMIMSLWAAVGSNNMILYLAGLSGIPQELYEAAELDGAGVFAKFWHITWPQLAPVTFFIFVMSIIGGLQGGFEMARTMTQGGPAGATTTLSYFIYAEGFETGRLGFASAVAWTLFALVFAVTIFNTRFGGRYVND